MAHPSLADGIASLFNSEEDSDLIVRCDDRTWFAHTWILRLQSEYFKNTLRKAPEPGYLDLDDDDALAVEAMLMFLYTGSYGDEYVYNKGERISNALFNLRVHLLAEKYALEPLRKFAAVRFAAAARDGWETDEFANAVQEMWDHSSDEHMQLRNCIIHTIMEHAKELYRPTNAASRFMEVVYGIPWLSAQVAQMFVQQAEAAEKMHIYSCPGKKCKQVFKSNVTVGEQLKYSCPKCQTVSDEPWSFWQKHVVDLKVVKSTTV